MGAPTSFCANTTVHAKATGHRLGDVAEKNEVFNSPIKNSISPRTCYPVCCTPLAPSTSPRPHHCIRSSYRISRRATQRESPLTRVRLVVVLVTPQRVRPTSSESVTSLRPLACATAALIRRAKRRIPRWAEGCLPSAAKGRDGTS